MHPVNSGNEKREAVRRARQRLTLLENKLALSIENGECYAVLTFRAVDVIHAAVATGQAEREAGLQ